MRDIKFRAWDKREKIMGEVNYMNFHRSRYTHISARFKKNGKVVDEWFFQGQEDGGDNIILLQYTGLKDTGDKEIYEGDIIEISTKKPHDKYPKTFVVEFQDGCFIANNKNEGWWDELINITFPNKNATVKILGNVFENPEFLEVE